MEISRETANLYRRGKNVYFDYRKWLSPKVWEKDNTIEEIKVNIPLRRIRALVLLFKEKRKENTEEFANPNIENVFIKAIYFVKSFGNNNSHPRNECPNKMFCSLTVVNHSNVFKLLEISLFDNFTRVFKTS